MVDCAELGLLCQSKLKLLGVLYSECSLTWNQIYLPEHQSFDILVPFLVEGIFFAGVERRIYIDISDQRCSEYTCGVKDMFTETISEISERTLKHCGESP